MKILFVEDEIGLAEAVGAILRKERYTVDIANDGTTGLDLALKGSYDCIVLDIMLPGMNGLDVLSCIRVKEIDTPVLLLTALSEVDDRIKGLDCGADDYLTKPFATGELLARIRAMLRRKGSVPETKIRYGDLALDLKKGELICKTESVVLGRKEVQMMELFISSEGNLLTKDQIVKAIWGNDDESEYNNVEVYISFLRKKLQLIRSDMQIKTRRGIGYCLDGGIK